MRRWLFKTLITISSLCATIPIFSCSCKNSPQLQKIVVQLPISTISIESGQDFISDQIIVTCYDTNNNKMEAKTKWNISLADGSAAPNWFKIVDNKITIKGNVLPFTYQFKIMAEDTNTHNIKSDVQILTVVIKNKPLLPPDNIKIKCEKQEHLVFLTQDYQISLDVEVTKQWVDPKLISKECYWNINNVVGPNPLSKYDDVFALETNKESCLFKINKNLDDSFIGFYYVDVCASSVLNPKATDLITLIIEIENGLLFKDETKHYSYSRKTFEEPWSLSLLDSRTSVIMDVKESIYGYPVSYIADDLCAKSAVTKLGVVILPPSINVIGANAFANQSLLTSIDMPGVKKIGNNAFINDLQFKLRDSSSDISLEYVGSRAFYNCNEFVLNSSNQFIYIGEEAFAKTALTKIDIGSNITYIDSNAFAYCSCLKEIVIETINPPDLGGSLYYGSTNPDAIKIPSKSIEIYKNNLKWSAYKNKLVGI